MDPSPVRVPADDAHKLALVINELVTNTVKHALLERDTAHIAVHISLEDDGDMVQLEFRDDGPGFSEEGLQQKGHKVGLELIRSIVCKSLRGELSLGNDPGAVTVLRFKINR